jgi:hypothetical protein
MEAPHQTLFLWGTPPVPWIAHPWLSQVTFYFLLRSGGPMLALLFNVFMVSLTFFLLWRMWTRHATPNMLAPLFFAIAIYAGSLRFRPRPELFTALFLVITIAYLAAWSQKRIEAWQDAPRSPQFLDGATFVLLFMFALWANLHGAVAMGILVVLLTALCDCVQDRFDARSRSLLGVAVLCVLATFINPNGVALWNEILRPAGSETFKNIDEWKPPLQARALWSYAFCELICCWRRLRVAPESAAPLEPCGVADCDERVVFAAAPSSVAVALVSLAVLALNARYLDTRPMWNWWRKQTRQHESPCRRNFALWRGPVSRCACCCGSRCHARTRAAAACCRDPPCLLARRVLWKKDNCVAACSTTTRIRVTCSGTSTGRCKAGTLRGQVPAQGRRPLYIDLLNAYPDRC